jgi:hypothetical protein
VSQEWVWIIVRHQARVEDPDLVISLCAAFHARVRQLLAIPAWGPDIFLGLWREQYPRRPVQPQFDLAA